MRLYLFDVTLCLSLAGPHHWDYFRHRCDELAQAPLGRVETWRGGGKEYLRVLWTREAESMLEAVGDAVMELMEGRPLDAPSIVVSWAARNLEHEVLGSLPPYQAV